MRYEDVKPNVKYRDKVTGFIGVCTGRIQYFNSGYDQILLETMDSTGCPVKEWFSSCRLEEV